MDNNNKSELERTGRFQVSKAKGLFSLADAINKNKQANATLPVDATLEDKVAQKLESLRVTGDLDMAKPPSVIVGTTGIVLKGDTLTKEGYLNSLKVDENMYPDLLLTEEEARQINKKMGRMTSGVNSVVPMACTGNACAFKSTCFVGDTPIQMYDGSTKKIKDLKRRDRIYSFNPKTRKIEEDRTLDPSYSRGIKPVFKITTEYGHVIRCTSDHPILSSEDSVRPFQWASIDQGLKRGDSVVVTDMFYNEKLEAYIEDATEYGDAFKTKIISIEADGEEEVFDVTIVKNKNFFAGGIVAHNCPYYEVNKAPVGLPCLVETNLMHFYTSQYMEEFDVDPSRITEVHLIGELSEFDIYEMRATKLLAEKYPTLLQETCMGFDGEGNPIINDDVSKVWDLKERLKKSRMKILEVLIATRKERAKTAIAAVSAQESTSMAGLRDKLDSLLRDVKQGGGPVKRNKDEDIIDG